MSPSAAQGDDPIKVLVVDDSRLMRTLISAILSEDRMIKVVGEAADPFAAREKIKALAPDVITLDVEMPGMNGLEFLEKLIRLRPMPVVMVSTLTSAGAFAAVAALELGAVDVIGKPHDGADPAFAAELTAKIKAAARAKVRPGERASPAIGSPRPVPAARAQRANAPAFSVIAIAASTGGVEALAQLLPKLTPPLPPIVIAQHMPAGFTLRFAERLNALCPFQVREAEAGLPLDANLAVLAPGGRHLTIERRASGRLICRINDRTDLPFRPSADLLFQSLAEGVGAEAIGVILTGLGDDGADGLRAMRAAGAATFAESEETAVIYGMPKAAMLRGAVGRVAPLHTLARLMNDCLDGADVTGQAQSAARPIPLKPASG